MSQAVILAGGLATRLQPLTNRIPKSMLNIDGKPFLEYQLNLLKRNEVANIVICLGYLGNQIKDYFGDGSNFSVQIHYSQDGPKLLGTGGALKKAEALLEDNFFVLYGDSYLPVNYQRLMTIFCKSSKLAGMVVFKNFNRYDISNVVVEQNLVKLYDKKQLAPEMVYIDAGLLIFKKAALQLLKPNQYLQLESLLQELVKRKQLLALEIKKRFYEIGSFNGLKEFRQLVRGVA
jgi:NDP-sugar pyrophosphorylase family protein